MGGGDTATRPDPSPSGAMACNAIPGGSARPRHHPTPAGTTTAPCPSRRPCLPRSPDEEGPTLDRAARPLDYGRRLWRTPEGVPPQPAQAAGLPAGREWGGERSGRVGGSPASLSSRQGVTPCEWAELPRELSTVSHSGQADAQRGQGVVEARDIELSLARAPRHEIHRQRGAACDRFRGFCNAHAAKLGLGNRFVAHDARWTDGADYLGGRLVRWRWLMR